MIVNSSVRSVPGEVGRQGETGREKVGQAPAPQDFVRVVAANRSLARRLCAYPEGLRGRNCRDAIGHALPCREEADCHGTLTIIPGWSRRTADRNESTTGTTRAPLRVERDLGRSLKLGVSYLLDYYSDNSYADLTSGLNSLIDGLGYRF